MAHEILRLDAGHFGEMMRLLDRAFGHGDGEFQRLLPNLYQPTGERMRCHYAVRQGGRLVAALGVYPLRWRVGGRTLEVAGIGGVGTDPDWRGKAMMSELLHHVVAELRRQGTAAAWLAGYRQRYRRFGWERAGLQLRVTMNAMNLRHEPTLATGPAVELAPLADGDEPVLDDLRQWHAAQPMHCVREPADFPVLLRHWHAQPQVARDATGVPVGYTVLSRDGGTVTELVGRDEHAQRAIVRSLVERAGGGEVTLERAGLPSPLHRWLEGIAEHTSCHHAGNWQVFDWPRVIEALLAVRCAAGTLPCGSVTLGLAGERRGLRLTVAADEVTVQWGGASPALTLDAAGLTRLMFGPLKPSQVVAVPREAALLDAWCPLPALLPTPDTV